MGRTRRLSAGAKYGVPQNVGLFLEAEVVFIHLGASDFGDEALIIAERFALHIH